MRSVIGRFGIILVLAGAMSIVFMSVRPPAKVEGRQQAAANTSSLVFLPMLQRNPPPSAWVPSGLWGRVQDGGYPAPGIPVDLRAVGYENLPPIATTATNGEGYYSFNQIPSAYLGKSLYAVYQDLSGNPNRLASWRTNFFNGYTQGMTAHIGSFDVGEVRLVSPPFADTVTLPYTFRWTRRIATTTDDYEFAVFDPVDPLLRYQASGWLGYVSEYDLTSLGGGFGLNTPYGWNIEIYGPDGGRGESHYRPVSFSSYGGGSGAAARQDRRQARDPYLPAPKPERR